MAKLFAAHRAFSFSMVDTVHEAFVAEPVPALSYNRVLLSLVANAALNDFLVSEVYPESLEIDAGRQVIAFCQMLDVNVAVQLIRFEVLLDDLVLLLKLQGSTLMWVLASDSSLDTLVIIESRASSLPSLTESSVLRLSMSNACLWRSSTNWSTKVF